MVYIGLEDDALRQNPLEEVEGVTLVPDGLEYNEFDGTHRVGSYNCSLATLREVLGPSLGPSPDGKVTEEWHFMTPFGVATLYDYKGCACSIGGHDNRVVQPLVNYINHMIKAHYS